MKIELHIERLILDGVDVPWHEQPHLQAAVEAELARLLAEEGLARQGNMTVPDVPAAPIQLPSDNDAGKIGRKIARSVYGGLRR